MSCLCKREKMAHFTSCRLSPWISLLSSLSFWLFTLAYICLFALSFAVFCSFFTFVTSFVLMIFLFAICLCWCHRKLRSNLEALCTTSGCSCAHATHWRAGRKTLHWVDFLCTVWVCCYFVASFTFLLDKWYKDKFCLGVASFLSCQLQRS